MAATTARMTAGWPKGSSGARRHGGSCSTPTPIRGRGGSARAACRGGGAEVPAPAGTATRGSAADGSPAGTGTGGRARPGACAGDRTADVTPVTGARGGGRAVRP